MRIVLTRGPGQASPLESGARHAGYQIALLPLTQQVLPEDLSALQTAVTSLEGGEFDLLLLTSANTVRALMAAGWTGKPPPSTRTAVVGPGTARALLELTDVSDPWMPREHSASGLLAELPRPTQKRRALLPQSAQARAELADGLRERGWDLTHVEAYSTVASGAPSASPGRALHSVGPSGSSRAFLLTPADLQADDLLLITSSTAAEAFAHLELGHRIPLLAIGEPTAQTMRTLGLPVAQVLPEPTAAGLAAVLGRHEGNAGPDW